MVKRIFASAVIVIGCLSFGATRYRRYSDIGFVVIPTAAAALVYIDDYCDGNTAVFVNSGSGNVTTVLPSDINVGAKCRLIFGVNVDTVIVASAGDIYGDDGSVISSIQIASGDNSYGASITLVEFESGKWTVDQMYGAWALVP